MNNLEFWFFHNNAYRYVPHMDEVDKWSRTTWISLPNHEFADPALAQKSLEEAINSLVLAEKLGFDGIAHSEQHGGPIGLSPSAMIFTAALAARTERIPILANGPILNAYMSPVRLAEEIAFVDNLSQGRLNVGLPMGTGSQYHATSVNPAVARARFQEGHELLVKALGEPGPFHWEGDFFNVPYVNLWPRPLQEPHPQFWVPAAGSRSTLELCADNGYVYEAILTPRKVLLRNCQLFRELMEEREKEFDPRQIAAILLVHVAESDKQARREVEGHMLWNYQNFFRTTFEDSFPPGHVSLSGLRGMAMGGGYRSRDVSEMTWQELWDEGWIVAGSPETVTERIAELTDEMGAGRVILIGDGGSEPTWMVEKSMRLFAEHVMPRFRDSDGRPAWAREDPRVKSTMTEKVAPDAGGPDPEYPPLAEVEGEGVIDLTTSHVDELRQSLRPGKFHGRGE